METIKLTKEHRGGAKSTSFSGRPEGQAVRKSLSIDDNYDSKEGPFNVIIPNDTTSFNPSFFLGLFYNSVKKLGSVEEFKKKFVFDLSNFDNYELRGLVEEDLEDCYQRCSNELNNLTGLD